MSAKKCMLLRVVEPQLRRRTVENHNVGQMFTAFNLQHFLFDCTVSLASAMLSALMEAASWLTFQLESLPKALVILESFLVMCEITIHMQVQNFAPTRIDCLLLMVSENLRRMMVWSLLDWIWFSNVASAKKEFLEWDSQTCPLLG